MKAKSSKNTDKKIGKFQAQSPECEDKTHQRNLLNNLNKL